MAGRRACFARPSLVKTLAACGELLPAISVGRGAASPTEMAATRARLSGSALAHKKASLVRRLAAFQVLRQILAATSKTGEFSRADLLGRVSAARATNWSEGNSRVLSVRLCTQRESSCGAATNLIEPDSRGLVPAISVCRAAPSPTEMAGTSSPHAASVFTKDGRARHALRPAMTRDS